ncbi:biliverdin-producing heme oxygenase [Modestobacter sp. NPDC049651]|uniref:biliverdin-producing heme oxygenase n=1 Tax=unclassified Modestobacter TaxID=2643866 RepID=UPI0033E0E59C
MSSPGNALPSPETGASDDGNRVADDVDVLRRLRTETAAEHRAVEDTLDLLAPDLSPDRLVGALTRLHGFWAAAEAGLDGWAAEHPDDAAAVDWSGRRRTHLYAADLAALGAVPASDGPQLPPVTSTDAALGRLYVLEGSTLGGQFIDRHLASLPQLAGAGGLAAFSPYGERTGAMWHGFRQATRDRVATGGDADEVVGAARETFTALAAWCGAAPAREVRPRGTRPDGAAA